MENYSEYEECFRKNYKENHENDVNRPKKQIKHNSSSSSSSDKKKKKKDVIVLSDYDSDETIANDDDAYDFRDIVNGLDMDDSGGNEDTDISYIKSIAKKQKLNNYDDEHCIINDGALTEHNKVDDDIMEFVQNASISAQPIDDDEQRSTMLITKFMNGLSDKQKTALIEEANINFEFGTDYAITTMDEFTLFVIENYNKSDILRSHVYLRRKGMMHSKKRNK